MKKFLTIIMVFVLVLTCVSIAFAESDSEEKTEREDVIIYECPVSPIERGYGVPSIVVPLYPGIEYHGIGTYTTSGVYTDYIFSDYGGKIRIHLENSNDMLDDYGAYMQVHLCHKDNFGIPHTDDTRSVWVNGMATIVFTVPNSLYNYYFKFTQNFSSDATTTEFWISRGN